MSDINNTIPADSAPHMTVVEEMERRRVQHNELRVQELAASQYLRTHIGNNRPMKTKTTWAGKQKEYYEWCSKKGYANELVTDGKFLLFLTEMKDRPAYTRGRKRKVSEVTNDEEPLPSAHVGRTSQISWYTLDGYVNAIMDIWRQQHMLGQFPPNYPVPVRPPSIKEFLQNAKKEVVARENASYVDRGLGTIADEVDANLIGKLASYYWNKHNEEGLKLRADYFLSYALTSRGDNIRRLRLSEIGHKFYSFEGVSGAHILRTVWRKSKKNQYGHNQQNTLMRHSDVKECPFGALSLYFFYRFHIRGDPWPDFSTPERWYDLYVFPSGDKSDKPMTYSKHYSEIKEAQMTVGISVSAKTQIGRKTGASMAENMGASEASVDKNGHWQVRSRNGAYSQNVIPWECVRTLAGFPPEAKNYYLERALLDPPDALKRQIFPRIEEATDIIQDMLNRRVRHSELAGTSFLSLLEHMRIVILQDAAVLKNVPEFANHPVFKHDLFSSEEFELFTKALGQKMDQTPNPTSVVLQNAVPVIADSLCDIQRTTISNSRDLAILKANFVALTEEVRQIPRISESSNLQLMGTALMTMGESLLTTPASNAPQDNLGVVGCQKRNALLLAV